MDIDLTERRAHVTGAARGIGLAIARRLAEAGARVALSDVDAEAAAVAAATLPSTGHIGLGCDVMLTTDVDRAMEDTVTAFGGLDLLVNNAGIEISAPLVETDEDQFRRLLDINVLGIYRATKAAAGHLAASRGAIVNIASVAGMGGAPLLGAYCGSKAAVIRLSEVSAIELRDAGIRVNAVCPAFVDTEMVARLAPSVAAVAKADFEDVVAVKQGRLGTVDEVAEMVAFLASDEASWTTGAHYVLDGGLTGSLL